MGRRSAKEMSRYQVMHELSVMAGWKYEGPIEHDNEKMPQGSGYRHPNGERSLLTANGEVYIEDRNRQNVWHELRWVGRKTLADLRKELTILEKEQKAGKP